MFNSLENLIRKNAHQNGDGTLPNFDEIEIIHCDIATRIENGTAVMYVVQNGERKNVKRSNVLTPKNGS